jgi:bacteriocin-like protein
MDNGICELNIDELETVVGGTTVTVGGQKWELCDHGTPQGGGAGLYPPGTSCSPGMGDLINAFLTGFKNGGGTMPPGGGGSGSGSGSGGYPA